MDTIQIQKLIDDSIKKALDDFKRDNTDFRSWRKFDSVTDQFSPITGASAQIGFYGSQKVSQQTVTGSRGSNVALASLLTALDNLGLIIDSSS